MRPIIKNPLEKMMTFADFWAQALRQLHNELSEQQFNLAIAPITVGEEDNAWVIYGKNQFSVNLLRSQYASKISQLKATLAPNSPELVFKIGVGKHVQMAEPILSGSPKTQLQSKPEILQENPSLDLPESIQHNKTTQNKQISAQDILAQRLNNLRPNKKSENAAEHSVQKRSAIEEEREREEAEQRHTQTNLSPDYTFSTLVEGKGNHLATAVAKSIAEKPGDSIYNPFFVYGSTGLGKTHLVQAIGNELLRLNPKARVR